MTSGGGTPFHVITAQAVWDKLEKIELSVARVHERLGVMDERQAQQAAKNDEQDRKIRALELKVYGVVAGFTAAVIGFLTGGIPVP